MAARRLLIIMILLLAISTVAAALVPPPERRAGETRQSTSSSSTRTAEDEKPSRGDLVTARVSAGGKPEPVRASTGDQLSLVVSSARASDVSVPAFGLIDFAEPGAPARFDLLIERPGRFKVIAEGEGAVAKIVARRRVSPEARPGARRP